MQNRFRNNFFFLLLYELPFGRFRDHKYLFMFVYYVSVENMFTSLLSLDASCSYFSFFTFLDSSRKSFYIKNFVRAKKIRESKRKQSEK